MSEEAVTRGPDYDWKLEANHLQYELDRTRKLLFQVENSSERYIHSLRQLRIRIPLEIEEWQALHDKAHKTAKFVDQKEADREHGNTMRLLEVVKRKLIKILDSEVGYLND